MIYVCCSLVPRPPPAFFDYMKKSGQAIKAGDKAGDEVTFIVPIILSVG